MTRSEKFCASLFSLCTLLAAEAHAGTICSGSCDQSPQVIDSQNYQYSGYLNDLTVDSSQALPVSLNQMYGLLGLTPGAANAVNASFSVTEYQDQFGTRSWAYGYQFTVGGMTVYGGYGNAGSPFQDDIQTSQGTADAIQIWSPSYTVVSANTSIQLESREPATPPSGFYIPTDSFGWQLLDSGATALTVEFPNGNNNLETLFLSGEFWLRGSIQLTNADGVVIPFDATNGFLLSGQFSAQPSLFNPSEDSIAVSSCGPATSTVCPGDITLQPVPVPGAALLFISGLLGIGGVRIGKRKA